MLAVATLALIVGAVAGPAIPDLVLHPFADQRAWLGIPNFSDVMSNMAFAIVGVLGLIEISRSSRHPTFADPWERWPYVVLFAGTALVSLGSAYYHLAPSAARLVWDRLPIAVGFMGLLTAVVAERVSMRAARWLLAPLIALGLASVLVWYSSELSGTSDVRVYLLVQAGSMLLVVLMLVLYPPRYTGAGYLAAGLALYAASKALELADHRIFSVGQMVSGHTLKHFLAAAAVGSIVLMLRERTVVFDAGERVELVRVDAEAAA
jgi:hypothetical protein